MLKMDRVAQILGGAVELLLHGCGPRSFRRIIGMRGVLTQ
jgi:hypothetical protein